MADKLTEQMSAESNVISLPTGTSLDDLRPTIALARRLSKLGENSSKIIVILSKTGRSERMIDNAKSTIDNAGFDYLDAMWPQRDGFQAEFDAGRAGREVSNFHLKQAAPDVGKAMLVCWIFR